MRLRSVVPCAFLLASPVLAAPQALEISDQTVDQLPGGREADGIIGDFVLRNDRIEAVISGNLPNRKANMGTLWEAPTPGCLYDLCPRGSHNDQLTYFGPGRQAGALSSVRILKDGRDGEAIIRAELTPAAGNGLGKTHDYILREGWAHILIVSTCQNTTKQPRKVRVAGDLRGLDNVASVDGIDIGQCQDPADRLGYAAGPLLQPDAEPAVGEAQVPPGETRRFAAAIAVGAGPAEAYGTLVKLSGQAVRRIHGRVVDEAGQPAAQARLILPWKEKSLTAFVAPDGGFDFLAPGEAGHLKVVDLGRPEKAIELRADDPLDIRVATASGVRVTVTDERAGPLPCKVQFIGIDGTAMPHLGPKIRARGSLNQYQSENGRFTQALPPGKYRVIITRGIEYDHVEQTIDVAPGKTVAIEAQLKRIVGTPGWVSTDFHNHSTPSGDNYCGTDDRIINLAAEHVEFAPTTEHNRIYDWQPHIDRLGLKAHVGTIIGMELTGGGPHLNAFPLKRVAFTQDNGAPQWDPDPRISALLLRRLPGDLANRWVHLNHPNISRFFNDADNDEKPDGGFQHLESFIDAMEMFGVGILSNQPMIEVTTKRGKVKIENKALAWLQMLNAGRRVNAIVVSDAHEVADGGVGGWRTYVRSSHDDPPAIQYPEIIAHAKAGRMFCTTGPFLEVRANDDKGPGDTIVTSQPVRLHVRVQCNTWTDVNRIAVLVNGRIGPALDIRRSTHPDKFHSQVVRFEEDLVVTPGRDAHLIVVAIGEDRNLKTCYGDGWQSFLPPIAFHNPVFVDVDNNGFQPNHDTLDHPFLQARN